MIKRTLKSRFRAWELPQGLKPASDFYMTEVMP